MHSFPCQQTDHDKRSVPNLLPTVPDPPQTTTPTTTTPSNSPTGVPAPGAKSLPIGAIAGGTVGGVVVIVLLVAAVIWYHRRTRDDETDDTEDEAPYTEPFMFQTTPFEYPEGEAHSTPILPSKLRAAEGDAQPPSPPSGAAPPSIHASAAGSGRSVDPLVETSQEAPLPASTGAPETSPAGIAELRTEVENLRRAMLGIQVEQTEPPPQYPNSVH